MYPLTTFQALNDTVWVWKSYHEYPGSKLIIFQGMIELEYPEYPGSKLTIFQGMMELEYPEYPGS